MSWRTGGRLYALLFSLTVLSLGDVGAQENLDDFLASNRQLWKSFHDEMKTLEQAAHKVNQMLNKPNESQLEDQEAKAVMDQATKIVFGQDAKEVMDEEDKTVSDLEAKAVVDQEAKAVVDQEAKTVLDLETKAVMDQLDVTLFASPDKLKNGELTGTDEEKNLQANNAETTTTKAVGEPKQPVTTKEPDLESFVNPPSVVHLVPKAWWKGKNVCVKKTEKVEDRTNGMRDLNQFVVMMGTGMYEYCTHTDTKYSCSKIKSTPEYTRSLSTTYQCCEGFRRENDACVKVDLTNLDEALEKIMCNRFASYLQKYKVMESNSKATIFAPDNNAMEQFLESNGETDEQTSVLGHVVDGLLDTDDFYNEMVINSTSKTPLRINIYLGHYERLMTVNCIPMKPHEHLVYNAHIYKLNKVIKPVDRSVVGILDDPRVSKFKQYLEQEGLLDVLGSATAVTVFAPTNDAWDKVSEELKEKYSRGDACIDRILRHHIVPHTMCSAPISKRRISTADLDGELVRLSRVDGNMMVNDNGRLTEADVMGTNGVVHFIDNVLTPKSDKPMSQLLEASNHTRWLSLLERSGLKKQLDRQDNLTMFVPTEDVLEDKDTKAKLDAMDSNTLRKVMLHHVMQTTTPTCDLHHDTRLQSQAGTNLIVTSHSPYTMFTGVEPKTAIQCIPLGQTDGKACHSVAHEIKGVLFPPKGTTRELLFSDPNLGLLKHILEGTKLEKDLKEMPEYLADGFTMLAPSNDAFNQLHQDDLQRLLFNKELADKVLRLHILKEFVCCASVTAVPWPFSNSVVTVSDKKLEVNRDRNNQVVFGSTTVQTCDVITTDGIVHIIDSVIFPKNIGVKLGSITFGPPNQQITLFGI